ncbi:MAG TPA: hypothetical protein VF777_04325 [Phycisphaerales bacterium]
MHTRLNGDRYAGVVITLAIAAGMVGGCEGRSEPRESRSDDPASTQLATQQPATKNPATKNPDTKNPAQTSMLPPTTKARALILRHRGPSDRPPPVLIFAPAQADADLAVKDASATAPMGATPIVVDVAAFTCLIDSIPAAAPGGTAAALELEVCGEPHRRVLLDAEQSKVWIDTSKACVGESSAAWGYLRSARVSLSPR